MSFDDAVALLRSWIGVPVVVRLDPEVSIMRGTLSELASDGIDGALFAVDAPERTGVAVALFRDGVGAIVRDGDQLVVEQGLVTVTVSPTGGPVAAR